MTKIFWILPFLLAMVGCDNIEMVAKNVGHDPSQLLYLYAVMNGVIATLLILFSHYGIYIGILQSVRLSGAICVVTAPLLWLMFDSSPKVAIGVLATGLLSLVFITLVFWKDLYPKDQSSI